MPKPLLHLFIVLATGSLIWALWVLPEAPVRSVEATTCVTPPSGLVGWWPGDGGATDIAGGNDGALLGGTFFTTSKVGEGFTFDSDDDRVSFGHDANYNVQSEGFTVHFWLKGIKDQPGALFDVVDKSHGWVDSTGWTFQGDSGSGLLSFAIGRGPSGLTNFAVATPAVDVLDGSFHHFAGTWDGSTMRAYVDGAFEATAVLSTPVNNSRSLILAYSWGGWSPQRFFRGSVDELAIFNRALSATEIQSISNAGSAGMCKSGPAAVPAVSHWGLIVMAFAVASLVYVARRRLAKGSWQTTRATPQT